MDITFTIDSNNIELLKRVTKVIENEKLYERKPIVFSERDGKCCSCPYWTDASIPESHTYVKWGRCSKYGESAVIGSKDWCREYREEAENNVEQQAG